jgi:8-oxo-dGTP pyrophosphatase MutT (NUDIX family)/N-acetylglutamate synthase-like GNAT family acetyltransferase
MKKERFTLPSAVHLFMLRDGKVLLLRRFNTGYEDGNYSVVAGHLDGGERVKAAMVREAREEVGVKIDPRDLQVVGIMHRLSDDERIDFFLAVSDWAGDLVNREPHRCDQLRWAYLDALPKNMIPYIRRALENFRRGIWFDSFGWEGDGGSKGFTVRPLAADDRGWVATFIAENWGAETVVVHGAVYTPSELPGFVAWQDGKRVGLITYCVAGQSCEIVSLDSVRPGIGIGSTLIEAVKGAARRAECRRLWVITTNDNVGALRFYQRRGFTLVAVHRDALEASRRIKPEIPLVGAHAIPLRDEIELEMAL